MTQITRTTGAFVDGAVERSDPTDGVLPQSVAGRLLTVIAGLNAELDHDLVFERVCSASVELLGADAAAIVVSDGDAARVVASCGLPAEAADLRLPTSWGVLAQLARTPRQMLFPRFRDLVRDLPDLLDVLGDRQTVLFTPVQARGRFAGALVAVFDPEDHPISTDMLAVADLLAAHGGAAIANALTFEDVVLRQAQEQAVIDAVADGIATVDEHGIVTGWNRAAADMTAVAPSVAIGQPLPFPVGSPEHPIEQRLGDDRWIEIVGTDLVTGGRVVALRDVSRQKALEAAKTMFVAATSHELKTPLTVIKSFADWLRDNGETAEPTKRKVAYDAIADSADELYQIVEKILLTARTEAGHIDLNPRAVEPSRIAEGTVGPLALPQRHHLIVLDIEPDLPLVWADPQSVRTVLGQLLENAIKYSPDGGTVTVSVRTEHPGAVRFEVADQGIGLAPSETEYLFMPFYQGETRTRSGVRGGVGLGLSIVRRLVEAQGGEVGAEGAPGAGARFWFTLPVAVDTDDDE